jgi:hypothetical protein
MTPIKDINPILDNKDRAKFEITKSHAKQGIAKRGDFFSESKNILHKYPSFCVSAKILPRFNIILSSSEVVLYQQLPFDQYPVITDVTYKAFKDNYYVYTSMMYVPHLTKHVVIF